MSLHIIDYIQIKRGYLFLPWQNYIWQRDVLFIICWWWCYIWYTLRLSRFLFFKWVLREVQCYMIFGTNIQNLWIFILQYDLRRRMVMFNILQSFHKSCRLIVRRVVYSWSIQFCLLICLKYLTFRNLFIKIRILSYIQIV